MLLHRKPCKTCFSIQVLRFSYNAYHLEIRKLFYFLISGFLDLLLCIFYICFLTRNFDCLLASLECFLRNFYFLAYCNLAKFLATCECRSTDLLNFLTKFDLSEVQFLNVEPATLFTTLLYVNLESFLQPLNADDPTDLILFESLKLFKFLQPLNVSEAIEVTVLLYVTFVSFVQPLNAASPTFFTALPSFTVLIDVFFANALSSTAVTS